MHYYIKTSKLAFTHLENYFPKILVYTFGFVLNITDDITKVTEVVLRYIFVIFAIKVLVIIIKIYKNSIDYS